MHTLCCVNIKVSEDFPLGFCNLDLFMIKLLAKMLYISDMQKE